MTQSQAGGLRVTEMQISLAEWADHMDQLKHWRITAATYAQTLREIKKEHAKEIEALKTELSETQIKCLYWREIALEHNA